MCLNRLATKAVGERVLLLWTSEKFQKHGRFEVPSDACDLVQHPFVGISLSKRVIFFIKGMQEVDEKWGKNSEEVCCKEMREHLSQRRTGNIVYSHTAACAKNRAENRGKNRDEKGHKDYEIHVRKVMQGKKKQNKIPSPTPAKGVGGRLLLQSLCWMLMWSQAWVFAAFL